MTQHDQYKELITLFHFGELSEKDSKALLRHVEECAFCKEEFEEAGKFKQLLSLEKTEELSEDFIKDVRLEARAALRYEKRGTNFIRQFIEPLMNYFRLNYRIIFGGATLLVVGFIGGYFMFSSTKPDKGPQDSLNPLPFFISNNFGLSNVRLISNSNNGEGLEIAFTATKEFTIKGGLDDEYVQKILLYSILNSDNPGVRLNSINVINEQKKQTADTDLRDALIIAAKFDKNTGVRREAIKTLKNFPFDNQIKNAVLYVLSNDENSSLRIEAINFLMEAKKNGFNFDNDVYSVFKQKVQSDDNDYVKFQIKSVLDGKKEL